jgi:TetR/AcrR family transcriptional regulator
MKPPNSTESQADRAAETRSRILDAALTEFAANGLAGARTESIATAAGVNKALLYYYFRDKDTLYAATLDRFFAPLHDRIMVVLQEPGTAGERFLQYVREHFDAIAESPHYARIFMGELMSASRGGTTHLDRIAAKYMKPTGMRVIRLIEEGIKAGEFRKVNPVQALPSAIGAIVHYFLTAPLRERFLRDEPQLAMPSIEERRAAVLDFIAAALFADRNAGIRLAAKIAESDSQQKPPSKPASRTQGKRK